MCIRGISVFKVYKIEKRKKGNKIDYNWLYQLFM